jgi:hypothetical protein
MGSDELDIIEGYGGYGHEKSKFRRLLQYRHPFLEAAQTGVGREEAPRRLSQPQLQADRSFRTDTLALAGKSSWSWTFHTYAVAITETDTVYYFDNIEVGRHPTGPTSKAQPAWFLINYAIGGISGWQIDMARYGNQTDMWVDYVRVYSGCSQMPEIVPSGFPGAKPAMVTISSGMDGAAIRYTTDDSEPTEQSPRYREPLALSKACMVKAKVFVQGLKPSPTAKRLVTAAPGVAGSVGINFVTAEGSDQALSANDVAGIGPEAQGNWNTVKAEAKTASGFITSEGAPSPNHPCHRRRSQA